MKEKFNEKVIPVILKFINTKAIQSIKNGKWKQGWMSPKDQCDNPYTTCN